MNRQRPEEPQENTSGTLLTILMCLLGSIALVPPSSLDLLYYIVVRDNLSRALVAAMGMTLVFAWARGRLKLKLCAGHALLLLFVISGALSVLYCVDRVSGLERAHLFFCWFVVTAAGFLIFRERKNILNYARWMAIVASVICITGILEDRGIITGITTDFDTVNRIGSTIGFPTSYAGYLLAAIFLVQCGCAIADRKLDRALFGLAFILLAVNLFYCRTLTSWVFFIIFEAVYLAPRLLELLGSARNRRIFFAGALLAATALALVFTKTDWTYRYITRHMPAQGKARSLRVHLDEWDMAWNMIRERPALGFGAGQYEVYLPRYRARAGQENIHWESDETMYYPISADNFIFDRLVEQGAVGLILFLGVFAWTFAEAFIRSNSLPERTRRAVRCQSCGTAAILGYALFHFPFIFPGVWGLIWANVAMLWALSGGMEDGKKQIAGHEKSGTGAAKNALPVPIFRPIFRAIFRGRFAAGTALFALFAFLLYLPLGEWMNDVKINKDVMSAALKGMDGSRGEFEGTLPLIPKQWRYYYFYGRALSMNNHYEEAVEQLKKAEKLRPYSILVLRQLRGALFRNKQASREELDYYTKKLEAIDTEEKDGR